MLHRLSYPCFLPPLNYMRVYECYCTLLKVHKQMKEQHIFTTILLYFGSFTVHFQFWLFVWILNILQLEGAGPGILQQQYFPSSTAPFVHSMRTADNKSISQNKTILHFSNCHWLLLFFLVFQIIYGSSLVSFQNTPVPRSSNTACWHSSD